MDKRANLPRRLNSIKVKRTSEVLKQTLRYRIVRNEKKGSLTVKKSFCKETENVLPSGKKQLFALNYLKEIS